MSRYIPNELTGVLAPINAELEKIQIAFIDTLSRKGDTPNAMKGALDMNSNRVINLPNAVNSQEPVTLGQYLLSKEESSTLKDAVFVDSLKDLASVDTAANNNVFVRGFYTGTDVGGGLFYWDSTKNKTDHNGGTVLDPARIIAWDGTQSDLSTLFTASVSGAGCFVRQNYKELQQDWFGVTGGINDTDSLSQYFSVATKNNIPFTLSGDLTVTGAIKDYSTSSDNSNVNLRCIGDVTITVDPATTPFRELYYFETNTVNSVSINGGTLTVDCNNKAASGFTFRHLALSNGGVVDIKTPIKIMNCLANDSSATYENGGLVVIGDYKKVYLNRPSVDSINRTNASGGATKGVSVSGVGGYIEIESPDCRRVLTPSSADADGLSVFGKNNGATVATGGKCVVRNPYFEDCQGRSFKGQISDCSVLFPKVKRQNVVSISQGSDFDFQFCGKAVLIEPQYEYLLNGATSPIGSSFSSVVFQQTLTDIESIGRSSGGTLLSEALIPRYCSLVFASSAKNSKSEVTDLTIIPYGSLSTTVIDRAIVEFNAATALSKTGKTNIVVNNVSGPLFCYPISYTGYTSGDLSSKLSFSITDCKNTLSSQRNCIQELSGSRILAFEKFRLQNNRGFNALFTGAFTFDFTSLDTGSAFTVDIASVLATNAPAWGVSGNGFIEVVDDWSGGGFKHIRVTVNAATATNSFFFTQTGGTAWGVIK
jgi:hypothetical protein